MLSRFSFYTYRANVFLAAIPVVAVGQVHHAIRRHCRALARCTVEKLIRDGNGGVLCGVLGGGQNYWLLDVLFFSNERMKTSIRI